MPVGLEQLTGVTALTPRLQEAAGERAGRVGRFGAETVQLADDQESKIAVGAKMLKRTIRNTAFEKASIQKMLTAKRAGQKESAEAASRIAEFYDKLPGLPDRNKLRNMIGTLRNFQEAMKLERKEKAKAKRADVDEEEETEDEDGEASETRRSGARDAISQNLRDFGGGNSSQQFAFFEMAREELEQGELDPDFQAALLDVQRYFETPEIAQDVRAGIAAGRVAHEKAATLGTDPATVRDTYRKMIHTDPNFATLFDALAKYDRFKKLDEIVETFCRAAGDDLKALTGPSSDPEVLAALLLELGKLKKLRTILDGSLKLAEDAASADPAGRDELNPAKIASGVLHFINKPTPTLADVMALIPAAAK